MPRVTSTESPLQLSEQTLAWLAERPHARSVWDGLTESAERPDLVATLRAILIDHNVLTCPGRCHACRGNWKNKAAAGVRHSHCVARQPPFNGRARIWSRSRQRPNERDCSRCPYRSSDVPCTEGELR
jgi:hypothetical protein